MDEVPEKRKREGIQGLFKEVQEIFAVCHKDGPRTMMKSEHVSVVGPYAMRDLQK